MSQLVRALAIVTATCVVVVVASPFVTGALPALLVILLIVYIASRVFGGSGFRSRRDDFWR